MNDHDRKLMLELRNLALEAADALWALKKGKEPDRDPFAINQDIHRIRPPVDALLMQPRMDEQKPYKFSAKSAR